MLPEEIHSHFDFPPADPVARREEALLAWATARALSLWPADAAHLLMSAAHRPDFGSRALSIEDAYRRLIGAGSADQFREALAWRQSLGPTEYR